ncbi:cell death protein 3-like [Pecten maximus]|uniref:cell death protein 3-like n=1 Tax=Pecten maximus TaxID=6579 RepID=UPI00145824E2|nr:cell death protein 3-like [Pecten maximus]XP_033724675.1 cell death protein 3-like [Pecten maximus]XP_033724676.1 cell death protein 3-like [Pecten maximus]
MEDYHLELLRKARPIIVKNMADIGAVCDHLIAFDILTESMAEEILSKSSNASKARALLHVLVMRGPKAFDLFHSTMIITKNHTIADILKPPVSPQKLKKSVSLPSPECEDFPGEPVQLKYSTIDRRARKHPLSRQQGVDDAKTEYGEYEIETSQKKGTESKEVFGALAQVCEESNLSSGILVSGSDQHVSHFASEDVSQEADIHREMDDIQRYRDRSENVGHSFDRWTSIPTDSKQITDPFTSSQVQTEQGNQVHVASKDDFIQHLVETSSSSQLVDEDEDEMEDEGRNWPATRKHSRPLVHLTFRQPAIDRQKFIKDITSNEVYHIDPKCQRRLVIFNNSVFPGLPPRTTGNIDATSLDLLFKKMSYSTKTYSDCSCERIMDVLGEELNSNTLHHMETFILILLSHGKGEKIYGSEGNMVDIKDITKLFDNEHCPALKGKPKLFFISACEGQQNKSGGEACVDSSLGNVGYDSLSQDMLNSLVSMEMDDGRTESSDMFIARATTQCDATFQQVSFGSQFIQALVHVIKEHSFIDDVVTLMDKMNQLVQRPSGSPLVEYSNTLPKKFYFFHNSKHSLTLTI